MGARGKDGNKVNTKESAEFTFPSVHNYPSRKEWERACWGKLLKSKNLIALLATPNERRNLVMRAAVTERINAGKKYRQIAEELWLSPQTISSIRKALSENGYRSYRERGKTERKKKVYYSLFPPREHQRRGRPVRTKYGTVYLP
ncbi:MAG: Trp family transcriptional regulator [Candidatus Jorgensenbacteria bacterium]